MGKPKVISLYTGAGGMDYGLEAAGFETAIAVDNDADAMATIRANRPWPVIERDIHDVASNEILSVAGLKEGETDLLAGGPPCQPFSKSGYWANGDARRLDDPRASTLEAYLRVLRDAKPKAFLLENVAGLAYQKKDEGLDLLKRTIDRINSDIGTEYSFEGSLLTSTEYGVPQQRERYFIIGHREGIRFKFPEPTHKKRNGAGGQCELHQSTLEPFRTAWDAIGDLEDDDDPSLNMSGKWADLLPSIPEGENYLYHTDRGRGLPLFGWRRRYWSFLLKLAKGLPAWTVTAQPGSAIGPFHWKNRRLSMRELCRIQTFPDDVNVMGSRAAYQRQIGNAVPSALAEILGLEIALMIGVRSRRRAPKLLPPRRDPVPPQETVRSVPKKYRHLAGEHEAHPGTGLGYGAQEREEQPSQ